MQHAIFAVELCLPMTPGDPLQQQLRGMLTRQPAMMRPGEKWEFYRGVGALLTSRLHHAVSGCWDFFDDNQKAITDHDMWFNGMNTREGSRREPSGGGDPFRGDGRYLTFTVSLLLDAESPSGVQLARHCKIPENALWRRGTFAHVLQALSYISFSSVKSDVVYLIPRDDGWGLTGEDLKHPKFHYLRQMV